MRKKNKKRVIIISSILLFIISLTQNAIKVNDFDGINYYPSIVTFLNGGLAILGGAFNEWLIWLANPIFFIAIYQLTQDRKNSRYLSLLAVIIGLIYTQFGEILANEGGRKVPIISLELGYWLWITSMLVFSLGTFIYFSSNKNDLKE